MGRSFPDSPSVHILLIVLVACIAYSNTFSVPFHLDDKSVIVNNPIIHDLRYFTSPSEAKVFTGHYGYHTFKSRYVGYLTFALNYRIHGLGVAGYHAVNILIHVVTAILVYVLITLTLRTPALRVSGPGSRSGEVAALTALLFACHPVQTEAVTYIWQRVTSLCAMFYILSLVLYVQSRMPEQTSFRRSLGYRALSILSAVLAMKTKQIAFTLPLTIALYEFMFFKGRISGRLLHLFPYVLTAPIIPLTLIDTDRPWGELIGDVGRVSRDLTDMSRTDYLLTQFRVLVTYLRLLFFPVRQNFNYD